MKAKFRIAGRGGQGIKFVGSTLANAAITAGYHATVAVDYTPSVRGGPIFCDVVISSDLIHYPFCDSDADVLMMLDQKGALRASECVCRKTICVVDAHTVSKPEALITNGRLFRCPFSKRADEHDLSAVVNLIALGWLSKFLHQTAAGSGLPALEDDHYRKVIQRMPQRFRETNARAFALGATLYQEASPVFA
jgi:2-oxoglutarate ferredoxin oxidoreductase subunit gamma